jgi:membrane-associated phospholipid phosphatase
VYTHRRGRRRLWAVAAVVGLVLLTVDVVFAGAFREFDGAVSAAVVANSDATWRAVLAPLTYLGQRGYVVVPLIVVTLLTMWRTRSSRPLIVAAGTLLATAVIVGAMKFGFGRTAPSSGEDLFGSGDLSYPSGHAVNTVIIWTLVLRMLVGLYGRQLRLLRGSLPRMVLVAVVALANAASMVGMNYHWVSDVVAGWLIGVMLALLAPSPLPAGYSQSEPAEDAESATESPRGPGRRVPSA